MTVERLYFPDTPIRTISLKPFPSNHVTEHELEHSTIQSKLPKLQLPKILIPQEAFMGNQTLDQKPEYRIQKDGQMYFWDNVLDFPNEWRKPNPLPRVFPNFSLPKILIPQEAFMGNQKKSTIRSKQFMFWEELSAPANFINDNKTHWENVKRKKGSKPHRLKIGNALHKRVVKTFEFETTELPIDNLSLMLGHAKNPKAEVNQPKKVQKKESPLLVWSVLFDKPTDPASKFIYRERVEGIEEKDKKNFNIGIVRLTEYATNYATKVFIKKNLDLPVIRDFAEAYSTFGDFLSYKLLTNGTYRRAGQIERSSEQSGEDYEGALLTALFKHDFTPLNRLIDLYSPWKDINDLAIDIGKHRSFGRKERRAPDLSAIVGKVEISETDGAQKAFVKNCALSLLAGGVYRSPGITELSGGIAAFSFLQTAGLYLNEALQPMIDHPEIIAPIVSIYAHNMASALSTYISLMPFITIHEFLHYYSSDENYFGLIPTTIVQEYKTPLMGSAEPEK